MRKLSATPKHIKNKMPMIDDGIEFDDWRRLQNALLALAALDLGWMLWVEQHVPAKMAGVGTQPDPRIARRIIERQARKLVMRGYAFLGSGFTQGVIDSDLYFTDDGALKAYK